MATVDAALDALDDALGAYTAATKGAIPAWGRVVGAARAAVEAGADEQDVADTIGITAAQLARMLR